MKRDLVILIGNIGSGKTTKCKKLAKEGYVIISKDDIRYSIGAGEYIFNPEYEPKIDYIVKELTYEFMYLDVPIVIDETNMDRKTRAEYIELAKDLEYKVIAIEFPRLSKKKSIERRLKNNHGNTPKEVWDEVWERKNSNYERPTKKEGFDKIIKVKK